MNQLPQPLTPQAAYQMLADHPHAVLIDIRSTMEYLFVGHPCGCVHIPWIDEPDWVVNPDFITEVRKVLLGGAQCALDTNCAPIILICRSGKRSLAAGKLLLNEGFTQVFHISEGFEGELDSEHHRSTSGGWRYRGLPWEQC